MTKNSKDNQRINYLIGERIRIRREELRLNRNEFCKSIEPMLINAGLEPISFGRLRKWETGENIINVDYIPFICKKLECDTGYLFGEYDGLNSEHADIGDVTGLSDEAIKWLQSKFRSISQEDLSSDTFNKLILANGTYELLLLLQQTGDMVSQGEQYALECNKRVGITTDEKNKYIGSLLELNDSILFCRYKLADAFSRVADTILNYDSYSKKLSSIKNSKAFENYRQFKKNEEVKKDFGDLLTD